jgi:hypothetical protein
MNRSSNRKGRKSANRVRKDSRGGGLHNLALTNKIHTLEEVGAAIEMIGEMQGAASKNSILKESPLPDQLREVETQLDEYDAHLQEWEEKEGLAAMAERPVGTAATVQAYDEEIDYDYRSDSTPPQRNDDQWSQPVRYASDRYGH